MSESKMFKGEMESVETLSALMMFLNSNIQHRLHWNLELLALIMSYYYKVFEDSIS